MIEAKDIVICCDMDDTLTDLLHPWIEYLNKTYGYSVKYEDVHSWSLNDVFPQLTNDQITYPLFDEEFWKSYVHPKDGAVEYVHKLIQEGFQFYVLTSTHYRSAPAKFDNVLFKYFPFIDRHNLITAYKKQMIQCSILIDDATHNIVGPYFGILIDAPHNRNFNECPHNVVKARDWKEVYAHIHAYLQHINDYEEMYSN